MCTRGWGTFPPRDRCHATGLFFPPHGYITVPALIHPPSPSRLPQSSPVPMNVACPSETASPFVHMCVSRRDVSALRQRCEPGAAVARIKALLCAFCWGGINGISRRKRKVSDSLLYVTEREGGDTTEHHSPLAHCPRCVGT